VDRRKLVAAALALIVAVVGAIVLTGQRATRDEGASGSSAISEAPSAGRGGETDAVDPDAGTDVTDERLDALDEAKADGTFGVGAHIPRRTASGWAGERVAGRHFDDWEPAIAADPNRPFVYRLYTRYGGPPACAHHCPDPAIILQVSRDDGRHWGRYRYLCACRGTGGEFDPQIEVAHGSGTVMAAFMRGYSVWFMRSDDHGKTWSKPVPVYGNIAWQDKPLLKTSDDGQDIYVAFNGPSGGDAFVAFSHDGGDTWHRRKATESGRYLYAFGGQVLSDGTVLFAESSLKYADGRRLKGTSRVSVLRSIDGGHTWTHQVVDTLRLGHRCDSRGCPPDFYDGHVDIAGDGSDRLVLVADGALRTRGIRNVFAWTSLDGGVTWTPRMRLSTGAANAGFPAIVGTSGGEFRVWFMDRRTGRWNVWYRTSTDGTTWTAPARISDATGGARYITPTGFREAYGDYGEIDVTDAGRTVAIWGEGPSYYGPGGTWFNRQTG
jgi:hypothetical protein